MLIQNSDVKELFRSQAGQAILTGLVRDWLKAHPGLRIWLEKQQNVKGDDLVHGTVILLETGLLKAEIRFDISVWHPVKKRYHSVEKDEGLQGRGK